MLGQPDTAGTYYAVHNSAKHVLVWLGEEADDIDLVLGTIQVWVTELSTTNDEEHFFYASREHGLK